MNSQNAGRILEHVLRRRNVNISELSRRMNINRRTLYNWFNQDKLQMDVICEIGQMINYDFTDEFKEEFLKLGVQYNPEKNFEEHIDNVQSQESLQHWMLKYIDLLEEYTSLLQTLKRSNNT